MHVQIAHDAAGVALYAYAASIASFRVLVMSVIVRRRARRRLPAHPGGEELPSLCSFELALVKKRRGRKKDETCEQDKVGSTYGPHS